MIYFDNAATTLPKPKCVVKEVNKCIRHYCGNPGRSTHIYALKSSEEIYRARESVTELFNFNSPENVVFTQNATHGLNIAIKGLVNDKMDVIISDLEHNSVIRPLSKAVSKHNGTISVYNSDIDLEKAILPLIKDNTRVLISTLSSNVTGKVINPYTLSKIAQRHHLKLILDASQYAGHLPLDLSRCKFDCLIAPGHKALFGLQGSGILVMSGDSNVDTLIEGGGGYDTLNADMPTLLPERFEAGTPPTPSIVGLRCGIDYILSKGQENISFKLDKLTKRAYEVLSELNSTQIYGAENGIVSFKIGNVPSSITADMLSKNGIACRSGLHCSPLIHEKLGTVNGGLVRISFSYFNSVKEIDKLYKVLKSECK